MLQLFSPRPKLVQSRICKPGRGFTLVEILVALVVSLILMGAVVSLFGFLGETFNNAKADIEMSERVAHTRELLQGDFNNLTVAGQLAVPGQPQPGALEIVEGRERDRTVAAYDRQRWEADPDAVKLDERLGDRDDILYMTLRNNLRAYVGKQGVAIPSSGGAGTGTGGSGTGTGGTDTGTETGTGTGSGTNGSSGGVIDDGTGSFSTSAGWSPFGTIDPDDSYGGNYRVSNTPGATATWIFTVQTGGDFELAITWPLDSATTTFTPRASSVRVVAVDGQDNSLADESIDQRGEPTGGGNFLGREFQLIRSGLGLNQGDTVKVTLIVPNPTDGFVFADAVKLKSENGGQAYGESNPPPGGTGGGTGTGTTDPVGSGYVAGLTNESPLAEVIWFVTRDPKNPGRGRLHRYQLLIAPDADLGEASPANFFYFNDISARNDDGVMVANSLEDLSLRGARRAHLKATAVTSGNLFDPRYFLDIDTIGTELRERLDETVVLDNVVAFDVQVYDEAAPVVGVQKPGTTSGFGGGGGGGGGTTTSGGGTTDGGSTDGGSSDPELLPPIDNSGPSFSTIGTGWSDGNGDGYQNQYKYKESATGPGTATWTFSVDTPGDYEVFVTWPTALADAATNAKFFVNGDGPTIEKMVNQRNAPSGASYGGAMFQRLGSMNVTGTPGTISVTLDFFGADGPIIADAAAIKPMGGSGGGGSTTGGGAGQSTGGVGSGAGIAALVAGSFSLVPNDLGYLDNLQIALANADDLAKPQVVGYGAFVDLYQYIPASLNYEATAYPAGAPRLRFNSNAHPDCYIVATGDHFDLSLAEDSTSPAIYDTWSPWYNRLAVNQIDDDGQNGVDDPGELYVPPPYSAPLRAVRAIIRVYEPTSGTVREVTVARSFDQD